METKSYSMMTRPETSSVTNGPRGTKAICRLSLSDTGDLRIGPYREEQVVTVVGEQEWPFEVHPETAALGPALVLSNGSLISRKALETLRFRANGQWPCTL